MPRVSRKSSPRPAKPIVWAISLALLTFLAFAPALRNDFVAFDDMAEVVGRADYNPPAISKLGHYWTSPHPDLYTPILWTVWGLLAFVARTQDSAGVHWDAFPYHLFNVAAHVGAALMAFLVLRRLVRSDKAAFFGAALFALHPIQVEAVAWVSGMKTPLSGFFALWSAWHYLRFSELRHNEPETAEAANENGSRAWIHYAAATLVFFLAMITKPTVVVLPLILGAVEWLLRKRRLLDVILPLVPWLVLAVVLGVINKNAQPAEMVMHPTLLQRVGISLHSLSFYLWKFLFPYPLLPDYSHTPDWLVQNRWLWLGAMPAFIMLLVAVTLVRQRPWFTVAVTTFALGGITTLGIIPYNYQAYSTVADRYIYVSVLGPALLAAHRLREREPTSRRGPVRQKSNAAPIASVGLVVCGALTMVQCARWADNDTLFRYTLQHNPDSLIAYRSLVFDASQRKQVDELLRYAHEGLAHRPGDPDLLQWIGNIALLQHRVDDAIAAFSDAVKADPRGADKLNGLGFALDQAGQTSEAEGVFKKATQAESRDKGSIATAYENLGFLAARRHSWDESVGYFQEALRIDASLERSRAALPQAIAARDAVAQSRPTTAPGTLPATQRTTPTRTAPAR